MTQTFQQALKTNNACSAAVTWVGKKTLEEAWSTCENFSWYLWLLRKAQKTLPKDYAKDLIERYESLKRGIQVRLASETKKHFDHKVLGAHDAESYANAVTKIRQAARKDRHYLNLAFARFFLDEYPNPPTEILDIFGPNPKKVL